ncbi:hypothetical protein VII00023_10959 [Vibrio ichthyoenteri ATCC 700023]|uniref:TM2 domain-containing protein n=1 Tax=Vibrio ichthyoenteri ATCC 700023 TaxID=870968 RepID=F9S847_9VIBR|nr:hypothetical protein [Vibrio ichthyoenteri]EGU30524.1 hypothetical protein VII00023_10959 [Vibrio ichthyoenteri ATCC 700023]
MRLFEPIEQLEKNEEKLRQEVNALSAEQKKEFFKIQSDSLKDPDTYATLNWLFLGGFHHCYLGKYALFITELLLFTVSAIALFFGHLSAIFILLLLVAFELPQLFLSQKIARQRNYDVSCEILNQVRRY